MLTHTIGEMLHNFRNKEYVAYAIDGECKGSIVICDTNDNNRLKIYHPDGYYQSAFSVSIQDMPSIDSSRNWVFLHELDENKEAELMKKIFGAIVNSFSYVLGLKEVDEVSN